MIQTKLTVILIILICFASLQTKSQDEKEKVKQDVNLLKNDKIFPEVKNLNLFKQTEFLPTLEHTITKDKNAIYASTFLLAWEEIRKEIGPTITIDKSFNDLFLVNESKSYINTLKQNEYKSSIEVDDIEIKAKAEFSKSLPFEKKLKDYPHNLSFDSIKVSAFGGDGPNSESVEILYYQDDDHFILKLKPKDKDHEIILYKSPPVTLVTFADMITEMQLKIDAGVKEKLLADKIWRYRLERGDVFIIPKFKFNIEYDYVKIVGNSVVGKKFSGTVTKAYQRNAFILNENGAEVQSEATIEIKSEEPEENKNLRFDKPFLLLLKRVDNKNPYFAMWVANAELTEKE